MSTVDPSRITNLSEKFLAAATATPPNAARPHTEELEIPEEVLVGAFEERGMTRKQVTDFAGTVTELTRAAHHAATKHNIDRIKTTVTEKRDPRPLRTRVSGSVGRSMYITASSVAVKEGEITLKDGTKKDYQTFGSGTAQVVMGSGMGSTMSQTLSEEVKAACEGSTFIKPCGK